MRVFQERLIVACAALSLAACTSVPDAASHDGAQTASSVAGIGCRDSSRGADSPTAEQLAEMDVQAATVCRWTNPATGDPMMDRKYTLTDKVGLSGTQAAEMMSRFANAAQQTPTCSMIDSPPSVEYRVLVRDRQGTDFRVVVPQNDCLGFRLAAGTQYTSWELTNLLGSFIQAANG